MAGKEAGMIELTQQQQQALDAEPRPARVVDPRTQQAYILVAAEQYEQIKDLFDSGPLTEEERRVILQGVWRRANWDDPRMDDYDKLPAQEEQ
jgi:hypothetical protein